MPPEPDDDLPIDTSRSMNQQSVAVLTAAHRDGLLVYRWWTDMADPAHLERLRQQLGPDAELPDDPNGIYYLVTVVDRSGHRTSVLLAEGEARPFVLALALGRDIRSARQRYLYRHGQVQVETAPTPRRRRITRRARPAK